MASPTRRQVGLALAGLGAALVLLGGVVVATDSDDAVTAAPPAEPTVAPQPEPTAEPTPTPEPTATATPEATVAPEPTVTPVPTPTPEPPEPPTEDPEVFLALLVQGLRDDPELLLSRLNQATFDRYGQAQCAEALPLALDETAELTLRELGEVGPWDYVTDEVSTALENVMRVEVSRIAAGQTLIQELHWQLVDGTWTWFSDCGVPLAD